MHEVALARQLASAVSRAAGNRTVIAVNVTIGALRQVVPDSLMHAWTFTTAQTPLDGAQLCVEWVEAIMECTCGFRGGITGDFSCLCPECGAIGTFIAGEEFSLRSIDVE